uniref:Testis specific serine kinase 4 n=1 Tax=Dromaius novaehollandiae TaxID=8790 RepID=A0A8C4KGZ2_DRONO
MGRGMAEVAPPATPTVLEQFGYELKQMLGHSTYGKVYKAVACQQRAQVAIKVISKRKTPEEYLRELLPHHIQDVILRLLCPASQRLSAQELLQTPWVSRFLPPGPLGDLPSATEAPET